MSQQRNREIAERTAREAAQTGDAYGELMAESARHASNEDCRRSARACREAIALRPDEPDAYYNLGAALCNSVHYVEAAQRFLEAKDRCQVGSERWGSATAWAFGMLKREACAEVAKPEWWSDEGLKALSASVVRAAPDDAHAHQMRAVVLCGRTAAWEAGPRSAAELREAATHFDRAAALCPAPAVKADLAGNAAWCRGQAGAMQLPVVTSLLFGAAFAILGSWWSVSAAENKHPYSTVIQTGYSGGMLAGKNSCGYSPRASSTM